MIRSMLTGCAILAPFAIGGTVLINVLEPGGGVVLGFIVLLGAACGIVGPLIDEKLNGPALRPPRRSPNTSA
jgi:hypothetical protein